jgi:uncharacterized protein (DUF1697 family)
MQTYILLFRGINVSGKNLLPMKDLVALLQKQGLANIRTYIQSGNVVCDSQSKPDRNIGQAIKKKFGFQPSILVLTSKELQTAFNKNPYPDKEGKSVHFFFCEDKPKTAAMRQLTNYRAPSEQFTVQGKTVYLWAPDGIGRSKLAAKMDKGLETTVTARNLNTVQKLMAMLKE